MGYPLGKIPLGGSFMSGGARQFPIEDDMEVGYRRQAERIENRGRLLTIF